MPNMQGNQGGQGGMKFVERTEMAIMQYAILHKAQQGEVTKENLKSMFKGNLQMQGDHFEHCLTQLVQEEHLKEIGGNKYTITDDGREDVQKLQHLFLEIPNVIGQGNVGGAQRKQGMTQQKGVGGGNVGGGSSGGTTGTTMGGQGTMGRSERQGNEVGSNQPTTSGGNTLNKGGATQPGGNR